MHQHGERVGGAMSPAQSSSSRSCSDETTKRRKNGPKWRSKGTGRREQAGGAQRAGALAVVAEVADGLAQEEAAPTDSMIVGQPLDQPLLDVGRERRRDEADTGRTRAAQDLTARAARGMRGLVGRRARPAAAANRRAARGQLVGRLDRRRRSRTPSASSPPTRRCAQRHARVARTPLSMLRHRGGVREAHEAGREEAGAGHERDPALLEEVLAEREVVVDLAAGSAPR